MLVTTPQSRLTPCQLPGRGAFWGATINQKLSPRAGKVAANAMSRRKGNDSKLPSAARCSPSASLTLSSSPINGGAFGVQYKHGVQCRNPSRSDRFNGVTGAARGPQGRNRNLPWPPGKKSYKVAHSYLFVSTPQSIRLTAYCLLPVKGSLLVHFISFSL